MTIRVKKEDDGKRIDSILCEVFPDYSRSHILRMIKAERIVLNNTVTKIRSLVSENDSIEILPETEKRKGERGDFQEPRIVHETQEYIILSKPPGLVVHPAHKHHGYTLVEYLIERFPEIQKIGENPLRPGIVHRLDKDASGLMVVARTQDMFDILKRQFKLHEVQKEYRILTYGTVTPLEGDISFPIARSKRRSGLFVRSIEGRSAITRYRVERYIKKYSLIHVFPETGRTHQIRVHFFSCGHPLVGDQLYRNKKIKEVAGARLMLHATSLKFKDEKGVVQHYSSEPDGDFLAIIKHCEKS